MEEAFGGSGGSRSHSDVSLGLLAEAQKSNEDLSDSTNEMYHYGVHWGREMNQPYEWWPHVLSQVRTLAPAASVVASLLATLLGMIASLSAKSLASRAMDRLYRARKNEMRIIVKQANPLSGGELQDVSEGQVAISARGQLDHGLQSSLEAGFSASSSGSGRRGITHDSAPVLSPKSASVVARERVVSRFDEAAESLKGQLSRRKNSKRAATWLTVAQYIIGGVLASSFVQETLDPKWVGGLGVLVLVASLFKQQFHPEIDAQDAHRKASQLRALIRSSEDDLAVLDAGIAMGQDHSDAMIELMKRMTKGLTEIESPEAFHPNPKLAGA